MSDQLLAEAVAPARVGSAGLIRSRGVHLLGAVYATLAFIALVLLIPLMAAIAIAIFVQDGSPVEYDQPLMVIE